MHSLQSTLLAARCQLERRVFTCPGCQQSTISLESRLLSSRGNHIRRPSCTATSVIDKRGAIVPAVISQVVFFARSKTRVSELFCSNRVRLEPNRAS